MYCSDCKHPLTSCQCGTVSTPRLTIFVVAYMSYFDNELILEQVMANTWRDAICMHSKSIFTLSNDENEEKIYLPIDWTIEKMIKEAFDCDTQMNVIQIQQS